MTFLGRNSAHNIAMKLKIKSKKARTVAGPIYYMPTQIEYTPSYLKRVDSPGQQAHISESFKLLDFNVDLNPSTNPKTGRRSKQGEEAF